jgi:hypothetical protein
LKKLMLAGLVAVLGLAPAVALAQAQAEEKMLVGQVQSVDETGTKIILTDGTKLLTPPGSVIPPGALPEGTMVVTMYREENGDKILTKLSLTQRASPFNAQRVAEAVTIQTVRGRHADASSAG